MTGPADDVDPALRQQAIEALADGTPMASVVGSLATHGMAEDRAAALCAEIYLSPYFDAMRSSSQRRHRLASVLAMQAKLRTLRSAADRVGRCSGLSRQEFRDLYYASNEPVVLEDVCADWRACAIWSAEYLRDRIGDVPVEVMTGRDGDAEYEINSVQHRTVMPYATYVDDIVSSGASNDRYLVAANRMLETVAAEVLWEDFTLDRRYLRPRAAKRRTFLWHGPAGTVTPLHHDTRNVMFHQVVGWKRFILVSPAESPLVYNHRGVFSDVDAKHPNLDRHPDYAAANPLSVSIGPGEALFIPVGWWHHVEALEPSISITTTAFVYPNDVDWLPSAASR